MARFISVPTFDIYDEDTGMWAEPEDWWLQGDLTYQSDLIGEYGEKVFVRVPEGYHTDLASIPRIARLLFVKNGRHRAPSVIHDYLCRLKLAFPRRLADRIFLEAMKVAGVRKRIAYPMYWAVRINTERLILIGKARKMSKRNA